MSAVTAARGAGSAEAVPTDLRWYAIYVRSRYEKKVHAQLARKKVESYLPLVEAVKIWSDRKKKVQEPLFKGYVFVKIDLKDKLGVLQTDGVVKFVGIRDRPSPIPGEEITWIRTVLGHPAVANSVRREKILPPGKKVEIIAGPFRGIKGIVSQVRGKTRLVIQVETIARTFSVEVPPEFLMEAR